MKRKLAWLFAIAAASTMRIVAQDSAPSAAPAPAAISTNQPEIFIKSDLLTGSLSNRILTAIYQGSVRAYDPRSWWLTCEKLSVIVPTAGGHPERMLAETNVVFKALDEKGRTNTASGKIATYTYKIVNNATNEMIELTGEPFVDTPEFTLTGDPIYWDKVTGNFTAKNQVMKIKAEAIGTNRPAGFDSFTKPKQ